MSEKSEMQGVINVLAFNIANLEQRKATGELIIEIKFDEGKIPDGGFQIHLHEQVDLAKQVNQQAEETKKE